MTIQDRLSEIEESASKAREVYDMLSPEHRYIALANYTMGEEYIADVPKLVKALRCALDELYLQQHGYWEEQNRAASIQKRRTEIERILEGKNE